MHRTKYIDEEERNKIKDNEWAHGYRDRGRDRLRDRRFRSEKDHETGPYQPKVHRFFKELIVGERKEERGRNHEERRSRSRSNGRRGKEERPHENAPSKGVIHTISRGPTGGDSTKARKRYARGYRHEGKQVLSVGLQEEITFGDKDLCARSGTQNDPMVIRMDIANYLVHKVLVDSGSSVDIIFSNVLRKMDLGHLLLKPMKTPLVGFGGSQVIPEDD
ncbi:UNVERIFIED_CONTAM: hypothetical protein Sradi_2374900 [Sesamum radiatum]|uniref:Uncharacterized protein n=1 Tax=Sesamum radiatum TaxID=300843 RepID=A0AAW2T9A4_SESRA